MKTTAIIAVLAAVLALMLGFGVGFRVGSLPQSFDGVEIITLDVPADSPESAWTAALATWKDGSAEYQLKDAAVAGRDFTRILKEVIQVIFQIATSFFQRFSGIDVNLHPIQYPLTTGSQSRTD